MKKLLRYNIKNLCVFAAGICVTTMLSAQCPYSFSNSNPEICLGDSSTLTILPVSQLTTTSSAGNGQNGCMFQVVAVNNVSITSFDALVTGTNNFEVYYRAGELQGFENSSAGWTLLGSASSVNAASSGFTEIPIYFNVPIAAGDTGSFYVTTTAGTMSYTNGSSFGSVYAQDGNIKFLEGYGKAYPFGGTFNPRIFNGNINYALPGSTSWVWSTGATTSSIQVSPTTTTGYTVTMTVGGCTVVDTDSVFVNTVDLNLGPDTGICPNAAFILSAPGSWASGAWNDGAIGYSRIISQPGTYSLTVTNSTGCEGSDEIIVSLLTPPAVDLGPDVTECDTIYWLDAGNAGATFAWNNGETTQMLGATNTGTYLVTVTGANGCIAYDTVSITLFDPPSVDLGADKQVCVDKNEFVSFGTTGNFASVAWSTGASTNFISVGGTGTPVGVVEYVIFVTDDNGCTATDTIKVRFKNCLTGADEIDDNAFVSIFPNPTTGQINIELNESGATVMNVYATDGRLVRTQQWTSVTGVPYSTQLDYLETGYYLLEINTNGRTAQSVLVIQ